MRLTSAIQKDGSSFWNSLNQSFKKSFKKSSSLVKIFVSSRNDQDIVCHLQEYPNLEISSELNRNDILFFVSDETDKLIKRKKLLALSLDKDNLKTEIIKQVTEKADGMLVLFYNVKHVPLMWVQVPVG